jgi:hypothetical protein
MRTVTVTVSKPEHLRLLGIDDLDFFGESYGVRLQIPDLTDPFNWTGLPDHIQQRVIHDYWAKQEKDFVLSWVNEATPEEPRLGLIAWADGYKLFSPMEGESVPHNPMLTIRENMQLDQIRDRKASDPVISEIGLISGALHAMALGNGKIYAKGSMDRLKHHTLCPEVEVSNAYLFQHAGHIWKHTHSNFHSIGITGMVELYVPVENAELEYLVQGKTHQYEVAPPGRGSRIAEFVDLTKETSQGVGRNESLAVMIGNMDIADSYPQRPLTPEELADREAAIKEAQEGKLDYLLEGTQWDPRNRK